MPTTGIVSDILSFSVNDGPGIRTVVFLKGCPLNCKWCHNPENGRATPQVLYRAAQCLHCGACEKACKAQARNQIGAWKTDGTNCVGCGECVSVCPAEANTLYGKRMTPEATTEKVLRDKPFFRETGGVTFSGGEPLIQAQFIRECAVILKNSGVHCAVETSCFAKWELLEMLCPYIDLWLCDWKISDPELHREMTGQDNRQILENLRRLSGSGANMILRCPVIPGVNDCEPHFRRIGEIADELSGIIRIEIMPYHAVGNDKRKKMGLPNDGFKVPGEEEKKNWGVLLENYTVKPVQVN